MVQHLFRLLRLLGAGVIVAFILVVTPAQACGCGVYIPLEGEADVTQERALIRWDGQTEDIVMALDVQGDGAEAAWILPVPAPATFQLGDAQLFETLQELTKPRQEQAYGLFPSVGMDGEGATVGSGAPVTLLAQRTLGPFEVSSLAASEADALSEWLAANGYEFPAELAGVLDYYVEQEWFYVAVKLTPEASGEALTGTLDPLWVTFESEELVYPMRPSALAQNPLPLFLYVLADHRVEKPMQFGTGRVSFADWVEPASLEPDSPLAPFVTRTLFLTKFEEFIWDPASIDQDFVFSFAARDEIYHDVEVEYVYDIAGIPIRFLLVGLSCLVLLVGLFGVTFFLLRRQRAAAPA